jgi:magnesium-transporting ATPase (P-type)
VFYNQNNALFIKFNQTGGGKVTTKSGIELESLLDTPNPEIPPSSTTQIQSIAEHPKKRKRNTYILLCLFAFFQIITTIYTAYFKLDGSKKSLNDFHAKKILQSWVIICLVIMSLFSFISYNIIPKFEKADELSDQEDKHITDRITRALTDKSLKELTLVEKVFLFAALSNTLIYVYTSFHASRTTFADQSWCKDKSIALVLALFCAVGVIGKESFYTIPRATGCIRHLFKIKTLYWTFVNENEDAGKKRVLRIVLGILLFGLALLTIPFTLAVGSESDIPKEVLLPSAFLTAIVVYICSVYGLCRETIDDLNGNKKKKTESTTQLSGSDPFYKRAWKSFSYTLCGICFTFSCLVSASGAGFSWEQYVSKRHASYALLLTIFIIMTLAALIGKILFCDQKRTIQNMVDAPNKIKQGLQYVFSSQDSQQTI